MSAGAGAGAAAAAAAAAAESAARAEQVTRPAQAQCNRSSRRPTFFGDDAIRFGSADTGTGRAIRGRG